jgi:hypothetical protein
MTATIEILAQSRPYLWAVVSAIGEDADSLTLIPVDFAFVADGDTLDTATWVEGSWEPTTTRTIARVLVGPGGTVTLSPGDYRCYLRVSGVEAVPVLFVGVLRVI